MTSLEIDKQVQTASDRKLHFIIAGSKLLHLIFQEFGLEFIFCPEEDSSLLLHVDLKKKTTLRQQPYDTRVACSTRWTCTESPYSSRKILNQIKFNDVYPSSKTLHFTIEVHHSYLYNSDSIPVIIRLTRPGPLDGWLDRLKKGGRKTLNLNRAQLKDWKHSKHQ